MTNNDLPDPRDARGHAGGSWDRAAHERLYGLNLNTGLGDFLVQEVAPKDFLEFGAGLCGLAKYLGARRTLGPSFCLEPEVEPAGDLAPGIELLNVDVLASPAPRVLDRLFDLVLSIEVAEHIPRDRHEALFDFLVSRAGRMIVFSGARPGQGGHGHVAERPELEWREEFTRRGCRFDPALTMRARSMSNPRNINHRKNLQVFQAPFRSEALLAMEARVRPYLQDLLTILLQKRGRFTGKLFHVDPGSSAAEPPGMLQLALQGRPLYAFKIGTWKADHGRHMGKNGRTDAGHRSFDCGRRRCPSRRHTASVCQDVPARDRARH